MKKVINKNKNKIGNTGAKMIATGMGLALGAGAYYLLGPKSKTHQKKVSGLMSKMKKEIESENKKTKDISVPLYNKAVDVVSTTYAKEYKAHEKEIKAFAKTIKGEWKSVTKKPIKKSTKVQKRKL
jgi:hypothetical protein